jgi:hypothetical protein
MALMMVRAPQTHSPIERNQARFRKSAQSRRTSPQLVADVGQQGDLVGARLGLRAAIFCCMP